MFGLFKRKKTEKKKKLQFQLGKKIKSFFSKKGDDRSFDELEKILFEADLGVETCIDLVEKVKKFYKLNPSISEEEVIAKIKQEIYHSLSAKSLPTLTTPLHVIMIIGVNGSGKTTNLAKLANYYKKQNKKMLIAAADTFRAAAVEQLDSWAHSIGIDIVKSKPFADPSAVVFDAMSAAIARKCDVLIIDTAGRLHTKTDLMHELQKITKVCKKHLPDAPHETLLTLDATTGQNAIDQIQIFHKFTPISGIILTKLDGTAKGGIVVAIEKNFNIPVKWVGVGEDMDDLIPFDPKTFVDDLFSS